MTDAYFDELGIAWRANIPDTGALTTRLRTRLRWQTLLIRGVMPLGLLLATLGLSLGAWTIWIGWGGAWNFVTRGIAIFAISTMCGFTSWSLRKVANDESKALSEMIDLSIARAENTLMAIRLGLYACALAAVFGMLGYEIRTHLSHPPAMSPLHPLALLALFALVLFLWRMRVTETLARSLYLKRILTGDGT